MLMMMKQCIKGEMQGGHLQCLRIDQRSTPSVAIIKIVTPFNYILYHYNY